MTDLCPRAAVLRKARANLHYGRPFSYVLFLNDGHPNPNPNPSPTPNPNPNPDPDPVPNPNPNPNPNPSLTRRWRPRGARSRRQSGRGA